MRCRPHADCSPSRFGVNPTFAHATRLRARALLFAILMSVAWTSISWGQNPDYQLSVTSTSGDTGDVVNVEVLLDNLGAGLEGWSFGVCQDPADLTLVGAVIGSASATVNLGGPPEFYSLDEYTEGFTVGAVVCTLSCATLNPGTDLQLNTASYQIESLAPATLPLEICNTLGVPPVSVVVVTNSLSEIPVQTDGQVEVLGPIPRLFGFVVPGSTAVYDPGDGIGSFDVPLFIAELPSNPTFPNGVQGFTMSLECDPAFVTPTGVTIGASLQSLNGGMGPDLFLPTLAANGIALEVTTAASPVDYLIANGPQDVAAVQFDTNATNLLNNAFGVTTTLSWTDNIVGMSTNSISVGGAITGLTLQSGSLLLDPEEQLLRGDANDDGSVDIADALTILGVLFNAGVVVCVETTDTNDSGSTDIADAVTLLDLLFNMGADLPAPFPDCGFDPTGPTTCPSFQSCP